MRKITASALSIILAISLSVWGICPALADEVTNGNSQETAIQNKEATTDEETGSSVNNYNLIPEGLTLETIDEAIEKDYTSKIEALCSEGENLLDEIASYEDYFNNVDKVQAFYKKIVTETNLLCLTLREYAALYTELAINSNLEDEEKAATIEGVYNIIYKDAYDAIDSQIYHGLIESFNNAFLDGILKTMPDNAWADEYHYLVADEKLWNEDAHDDVYYLNYKTHKAIKYLWDEESFILPYGGTRALGVLASFNETLTELKTQSGLIELTASESNNQSSTTTTASSSAKEEYTPGWHEKDGAWYYFDKSGGICTNQWVDSKYFVGPDGKMVTNAWVDNYYVGTDGAYVTDTWIDGYYLGTDGVWIPNYGEPVKAEVDNSTYTETQNSLQVCWTPKGECYHSPGCSTLSRSKTIIYGTIDEAKAIGKRDCSKC